MPARELSIRITAILLIASSLGLAASRPVAADPAASRCGQHTKIVTFLEKRYGETPRGIGLVSDKGVMQVYVSEENGTWTILVTSAEGQACVMAAGKGWEDVKQEARGKKV
ncbi:MAG: hypothetical protein H2045_12590 [Rhizobiales bacterium]|nr:hypothetical protein [Hyphomicrobiales bacterium]